MSIKIADANSLRRGSCMVESSLEAVRLLRPTSWPIRAAKTNSRRRTHEAPRGPLFGAEERLAELDDADAAALTQSNFLITVVDGVVSRPPTFRREHDARSGPLESNWAKTFCFLIRGSQVQVLPGSPMKSMD